MEQATATEAPAPATGTVAAAARPKCEKCDADAISIAVWPWGEQVKVCGPHQAAAVQLAENLGRTVTFAALAQVVVQQPLTRDERAKMKGELYAAEAEIDELKARGLNLFNENTALTRQLQSRTVRLEETQLQLRDKTAEVELLQEELEKREAAQGELADEVNRLRTLVKFQEPTVSRVGEGEPAPDALHSMGLTR